MDKKWKKKWVAALRSGKYVQGRGGLKYGLTSPAFCCLGVLCDIVEPKGWINDEDEDGFKVYFPLDSLGRKNPSLFNQQNADFPPDSILKKVGLSQDQCEELAAKNDGSCSFKEIADHIEENL